MALGPYALSHECGHFILHAKNEDTLPLEAQLERDYVSVLVESPWDKDFANWDQDFLRQKFLELTAALGKKRGRKPLFNHEQLMELAILHRTTRPRDHGIGLETRTDGWAWTVDLFRELILRLHPNKQCSRATADRLHREFREKR